MAAPPHTYRFPYARTRGFRSSGQAVSPHRYIQDKKHKLEHQIEIDKTIEEFYDFFVDYQDLNSENKETLNLIMRRLLEVQANEEAE